ncbi:MAG: MBL fold metallo-hydrolase [Lactobacillales bacterium]|jgi:phosphoribosyl 1,2-cyclic phosphodiesterase|nr:MBL fold metallo-hydrolase [Lactobacillales bacterium]MDR1254368.1 MBL fold metallo-hydrolase [Oscillospiraceae bacterium]
MTKIYPLFSGSRGNSTYLECQNTAILIDAGCSTKQIEAMLKKNELDLTKIKSILITHEHSDHIMGLRTLATRYGIKVYSSKGTIKALIEHGILNDKISYEAVSDKGFEIGDIFVKPFFTSHDSNESFGYVVTTPDQRKTAFATDMGFVSNEVRNAINGCDVLFIESNHDVGMLENGKYPYFLKRRILSNKGHLSNEACAQELPGFVKKGTTRIVLSHLSEQNNIPKLAYETSIASLLSNGMKSRLDFDIKIASKENHLGEHIII